MQRRLNLLWRIQKKWINESWIFTQNVVNLSDVSKNVFQMKIRWKGVYGVFVTVSIQKLSKINYIFLEHWSMTAEGISEPFLFLTIKKNENCNLVHKRVSWCFNLNQHYLYGRNIFYLSFQILSSLYITHKYRKYYYSYGNALLQHKNKETDIELLTAIKR